MPATSMARTSWAAVTPLLDAAGLRCFAPDQLGYSPGARPADVGAYALPSLVLVGLWGVGGGAIIVEELARELQARAGSTGMVVSEHDIPDGIARSLA